MVDASTARPLSAVRLRWRGRFGFFLRAEAPVVGLGYPVPPRTAVLGLVANVLGLPKDALATELEGAHVALSGRCPRTHWHACNLRKIKAMRFIPPELSAAKPVEIMLAEETNTQSRQEWLCDPDFEVIAALPDRWQAELSARVREGRTHFTPCMGLSEMVAHVEHLSDETLTPLPEGAWSVRSVVPEGEGTTLDVAAALADGLRVLSLSLPRTVTAERRFTHATYLLSPDGAALPVRTAHAWQSSVGAVMFL